MLVDRGRAGPHIANGVIQMSGGNAGFGVLPLIPAIIVAGSGLILGGGTLWHLHERHTEKEDYQRCIDKFTAEPYNMPAMEAAMVCTGQVEKEGFKFGFNAPSLAIVGAAGFTLYLLTKLAIEGTRK